mmetsp:Transcript_18204/g.56721  ORF Transcript_18204/g.56721 Transcript_18204/m.56721 type:complete len:221 (+) Transcript_18204:250-912(+)
MVHTRARSAQGARFSSSCVLGLRPAAAPLAAAEEACFAVVGEHIRREEARRRAAAIATCGRARGACAVTLCLRSASSSAGAGNAEDVPYARPRTRALVCAAWCKRAPFHRYQPERSRRRSTSLCTTGSRACAAWARRRRSYARSSTPCRRVHRRRHPRGRNLLLSSTHRRSPRRNWRSTAARCPVPCSSRSNPRHQSLRRAASRLARAIVTARRSRTPRR